MLCPEATQTAQINWHAPPRPSSETSPRVGRWSEADSANRNKIARGAAMECAASLDIMKLRKVITDARHERGSELLAAVVSMLTKMI